MSADDELRREITARLRAEQTLAIVRAEHAQVLAAARAEVERAHQSEGIEVRRSARARAELADLRAKLGALASRERVAEICCGHAACQRVVKDVVAGALAEPLPLHRTEAGYPSCSTCDGGGCPDCTDPA